MNSSVPCSAGRLKRFLGGLLTIILLGPVPVYAWTMSGSWFTADGSTTKNANFSDTYTGGTRPTDTLNILYTGGPTGFTTNSVSITLWRAVAWDANPDRMSLAFTDNASVGLTGTNVNATLAVSTLLGNLSGTSPNRTFTSTATVLANTQFTTGNTAHTATATGNGTTQSYVQVTLTITPASGKGWTYQTGTSSPTSIGTFTLTQ